MNPYRGTNIVTFFVELARRLLTFDSLASDELQLLVLTCVALSGALVGTFLVLRKMTMLANSLSHTILLGIVIAFLATGGYYISAMLIAAVITGLVTAFLTQFLTGTVRLQGDASNGLVFTTLFALGIVLVTVYTRNSHMGLEAVMGNVDMLHVKDLLLVALILAGNVLIFSLFFKEYHLTTFDPSLARSMGISTGVFNYLLMIQVSATAVGGFRAVGVLMVLSFIVGPPLTARFFARSLRSMLIVSSLFGCLAALLGVATARHILSVWAIPLSTGGVTVCWIVLLYACSAVLTRFKPLAYNQ